VKHISTHELEKKSNQHLNIQLYNTSEELRNAEKEVSRIRTALERNEKQDRLVAKQFAAKLSSMEDYIRNCRRCSLSSNSIRRHGRRATNSPSSDDKHPPTVASC